ncbi:TPA: amidohydrolase family protein, partial [Streptococcus agalactiae]
MYIIKNGLIIDPQSGFNQVSDMLIDQGKIKQISKEIDIKGIPIIDASNKIVAPGLVDIHVHFREPGQTHKENIHTGALSAAVGGFTTVLMMANTNPTISSPEIVKQVKESAAKEAIKIETV